MKELAERLKQARTEKGLMQYELAELAGVTRYTISKTENEICTPDTETVVLLAKALDVSLDWLFGRTNERSVNYDRT